MNHRRDRESHPSPAAEPSAAPAEAAPPVAGDPAAAPSADAAEDALAVLAQERDRLLRLLAERDNQVKRMERDQEREAQRQRGELALLLLPVLDDLERALALQPPEGEEGAGHAEGLRLIAQRFQDLLAVFGLDPIVAVGQRFDPRLHEALVQLPATEIEKGTVIQELQRGYRLGELLIRPAKVAVAG
jgi:molecular chaperone GrpE